MSCLNRGRKLLYLAGIALLGSRIVIRGNFGHAQVVYTNHKPVESDYWQAEVATAML